MSNDDHAHHHFPHGASVHAGAEAAARRDPQAHDHVFLGADHARNERRVWWVIGLTAAMMVAEILGGQILGSMALTADGWHMSTHAGAMLITALAYRYARRQIGNPRFTFGTGKVGDLAAFASAVILGLIALIIAWESALRLLEPVDIAYDEAIAVAVLGLIVNLVSAWLLGADHGHDHGTQPIAVQDHAAAHGHADAAQHGHHGDHAGHGGHGSHAGRGSHGGHGSHGGPGSHAGHAGHGGDSNLKAAYLHVLADALTSVLAIAALLAGRVYGWNWLDPAMGIVGAVVIARWSLGLVRQSALVLLDAADTSGDLPAAIRRRLDGAGERITDLHVWQLGPGHHAAIVALSSTDPQPPAAYKARLSTLRGLSHVTVEVTAA